MDQVAGSAMTDGRAGDFDEFYAREYEWAVRFTTALTGDIDVAEEIVQDSFIRIAGRFSTIDSPKAYLRATLTNGAMTRLRRLRLERRYAPARSAPWTPDHLVEFSDVLAALPTRQRVAIVLRYLEDLDDTQIAAVLSCRRSTVRTLVQHGLQTLCKEQDS